MDIFKLSDYRAVIENLAKAEPARATRSHMAQAAGCSPSWITRVLSGSVQMTPDQSLGLAEYFRLNEVETEFFMALVDLERAATPLLRKRIQNRLAALKKEERKLARSIRDHSSIPELAAIKYYSSWTYAAVHVLCIVKGWTNAEVAAKLLLPEPVTQQLLLELQEMELVRLEKTVWVATAKNVHLPADHPLANLSHCNWRNRTIQQIHATGPGAATGLHYSAIHCLSRADIEKIHRMLKDAVLQCRRVIQDSVSEDLAVLCLDWYPL